MKIEQLIKKWDALPKEIIDGKKYQINISQTDAAKVEAIKELYPGITTQMVMHQLLVSALGLFEESLPYVQGSKITGEDEFGNPIYEDIGDTPKYIQLVNKHHKDDGIRRL